MLYEKPELIKYTGKIGICQGTSGDEPGAFYEMPGIDA